MSSIYIPSLDAFHVHLPKTGGTTVNSIIEKLGIKFYPLRQLMKTKKPMHRDRAWILKEFPEYHDSRFFTFVRHPATWYKSRFEVNVLEHWKGLHPQEAKYRTKSFDTFVKRSCNERPGFYTERVWRYAGTPEQPVNYIGKMETLVEDLISILRNLGYKETINPKRFRNIKERVSPLHVRLTDEHYSLIYTSEHPTYSRFNYDLFPPVTTIPHGYSK